MALLVLPLPIAADNQLQSSSPWLSSHAELTKIYDLQPGEVTPYRINGNIDCVDRKVVTRPFRLVPFQAELSFTSCVREAQYGSVDNRGYLQRTGTDIAGPVKWAWGGTMLPQVIPRSTTAFAFESGALYGSYIGFIKDFNQNLSTTTLFTGEVTHKVSADAQLIQLKDRTGKRLAIYYESISFSPNGKWMVADSPFHGNVRINLETFDVLTFAPPFIYNVGVGPLPKTAITSDGRYVAVASGPYARFDLYDLGSCQAVPDKPGEPYACGSINLWQRMMKESPGFFAAGSLRFIHSHLLSFNTGSRQPDNSILRTQYVLHPPDYPIFNFEYLAMGDSFASGEGAYGYKAATDTSSNKCHVSLRSYPYLIANVLNLNTAESVACSGAMMKDINHAGDGYVPQAKDKDKEHEDFDNEIFNNFLPGYRPQLKFIPRISPQVITISTVGNDIGFKAKILRCLEPDTCYSTYEDRLEIVREINGKLDELTSMYIEIKNASPPQAKIYVIGYPQIADPNGDCALNVRLNTKELAFSVELVKYLNTLVKTAAGRAGVYYVDIEDALTGYRFCETDSWSVAVNGLTAGNDTISLGPIRGPIGNESFHPNAWGHTLMRKKILGSTGSFTAVMPAADPSLTMPAEDGLKILQAPKNGRPVNKINYDNDLANNVVYREFPWRLIVGDGRNQLKPLTTVKVWLNSEPVLLATGQTDAKGGLAFDVVVPENVPVGFHTLKVQAENVAGEPIELYKVVYIAASEDDWNGNGIPNHLDACIVVEPSGTDNDKDGIDDACDGFIGDAPEDDSLMTGPINIPIYDNPNWPQKPEDAFDDAEPQPENQDGYVNDEQAAIAPDSSSNSNDSRSQNVQTTEVAAATTSGSQPRNANKSQSLAAGISHPAQKAETLNFGWIVAMAVIGIAAAAGLGALVFIKSKS